MINYVSAAHSLLLVFEMGQPQRAKISPSLLTHGETCLPPKKYIIYLCAQGACGRKSGWATSLYTLGNGVVDFLLYSNLGAGGGELHPQVV